MTIVNTESVKSEYSEHSGRYKHPDVVLVAGSWNNIVALEPDQCQDLFICNCAEKGT